MGSRPSLATASRAARVLLVVGSVALSISGASKPLPAVGNGPALDTEPAGAAGDFDYFRRPDPLDAWTPKITGWQLRERLASSETEGHGPAQVSGAPGLRAVNRSETSLRAKYERQQRAWKRSLARDVAKWIQREAKQHYLPDGPVDHWATFAETLERDGDDCDGLELLVFNALRDLGFGKEEIYRAIVYRESDGQHHMVTLWFEERGDPFVIDPTGAMTRGMPHMSEVAGWVPLKVFSEDEQWSVVARTAPEQVRTYSLRLP